MCDRNLPNVHCTRAHTHSVVKMYSEYAKMKARLRKQKKEMDERFLGKGRCTQINIRICTRQSTHLYARAHTKTHAHTQNAPAHAHTKHTRTLARMQGSGEGRTSTPKRSKKVNRTKTRQSSNKIKDMSKRHQREFKEKSNRDTR